MMDGLELVKKARIGSVVPIYQEINYVRDPLEFFSKISNYGRKKNSLLLESADISKKYGELSLGTSNPCLRVSGFKEDFEIKALNALGRLFLKFIKKDLDFCDNIRYRKESITGKLKMVRRTVNEEQILKLKTHADIIRTIAFKFKPTIKPFIPYCGLFGAIAYDFIDQFENLPENNEDIFKDPDYELYFVDNLFLTDHKKEKTYIIANALIMDNKKEQLYDKCMKTINEYEKALNKKLPKPKKFKKKKQTITTDIPRKEYENIVARMKKRILAGDVFQVVQSRTAIADYNAEPLDIYKELRNLNPSSYMFFINNKDGILLGASPEMYLRVQGEEEKTVEIKVMSGDKPRGIVNGKIDEELDSRYEAELNIDERELAAHTMLIDIARNDVAKVSKPGTRVVNELFKVEKYSYVQHLVSNVRGILKDDLDALHVYIASMNSGTLTGAPKIMAIKLMREVEKTKRGFYGGLVGYITPSGDFDSTTVTRSMRLKENKAYSSAGAGIVYDSTAKNVFFETENKMKDCLVSIRKAGGLK